MPAVTPDLGHGATMTFATGFISRVNSLSWDGISRVAVDTTTFDTNGGKTFIPSDTYDPGSLSVEMQFDSDASPPIDQSPETITLTFDDLETWSAQGFLTDYSFTLEDEGVITATAVMKLSGSITF